MTGRTLQLGHSPDADDAFMFWALATGLVETGDGRYEHRLEGIESLNDRATRGEYEVTALSLAAYPAVADRYALLGVGASVGEGYGPVLVAQEPVEASALARRPVAVPGRRTTAALTLRLWARSLGLALREVDVPFDRVGDEVRAGRAAAGLLIHEGQLTFEADGFVQIVDLGAWWRDRTGLPLPLGVNAVRRDLGAEGIARVAGHLRESIRIGRARRAEALAHALRFSRGLDPVAADRFVGMYVNDETERLSADARLGARRLLSEAAEAGLVRRVEVEFIDPPEEVGV